MIELEGLLRAVGDELAFPPTPDLLDRVAVHEHPTPRRGRRVAVVALATVAFAFGAVLALSPGARSALRELLGIGGISVARVDELPRPGAPPAYLPGEVVTLAEAKEAVNYPIRLLPTDDPPARVLLDRSVPGGVVTIAWCCRPRLVLTQLVGTETLQFVRKLAGPTTTITPVTVDGERGYWIAGAPHIVLFVDRDGGFHSARSRLAGNVLLWTNDGITFRLEGRIGRDRALALAGELR